MAQGRGSVAAPEAKGRRGAVRAAHDETEQGAQAARQVRSVVFAGRVRRVVGVGGQVHGDFAVRIARDVLRARP
jgi:hypothetical protein